MLPLYSIKPRSRKRFIKKLTRDRVVPIISANVSCVIFGINVSGSPGLPNLSHQEENSRQTLFTGIEKLIDKVELGSHTAG